MMAVDQHHVLFGKKVIFSNRQDEDVSILIENWEFAGSGYFGTVYKCLMTSPEEKIVAGKRILAEPGTYEREIAIHRTLNHPYILKLLYYYPGCRKQDQKLVWNLILEFMPSTAAQVIDLHGHISLRNVKLWTYQLSSALAYLHSRNIMHRDLKPSNILVDVEKGDIKLCDFGLAKYYTDGEVNNSYQVTRFYRAPELALGDRFYGLEIDMWSLGCVLCEFLLGRRLFSGDNNAQLLTSIHKTLGKCCIDVEEKEFLCKLDKNKTDWTSILPAKTPSKLVDLISKLLKYNPEERLTAAEIMFHPFLNEKE